MSEKLQFVIGRDLHLCEPPGQGVFRVWLARGQFSFCNFCDIQPSEVQLFRHLAPRVAIAQASRCWWLWGRGGRGSFGGDGGGLGLGWNR